MSDRPRSLKSFLDTLTDTKKKSPENKTFEFYLKNGQKVKFELFEPEEEMPVITVAQKLPCRVIPFRYNQY